MPAKVDALFSKKFKFTINSSLKKIYFSTNRVIIGLFKSEHPSMSFV